MMDTKPNRSYHPLPNKLFNGIARALNTVGLAKTELSEEALIAEARRQTGLERFGDESFLPTLRTLLGALRTEAELNPFGQFFARTNTLGSLKNRLHANACFEAHPDIRQRKIPAPIIIIGPHRSGTTRLHRMMAEDTRLQHLKTWEGFNPGSWLNAPDLGKAARYKEVKTALNVSQRLYPGAFVAHPMHADWPEEEMLLLNHSFCGFSVLGAYHIPSYYEWFLNGDKTHGYRYMADLMNLISWSRGDAQEKRWLLKNPQHMLDLDVLMKVFPDAKLVFIHRDPLKTVASTMSLMWRYAVQHTDRHCRGQVRDVWLDFCEQAARRCIEGRTSIPANQQLDIYYEEMNRDWRAVLRRVYEFAGLDFTPTTEQALDAWLTQSESENRHGGHRYSLDEFGTSNKEVDARMMFYRERYAIPYERN
jgi:hypothetical protein